MQIIEKFLQFTKSLENGDNSGLLESINEAFVTLMESREITQLTEAPPVGKLPYNNYRKLTDFPDDKKYLVHTKGKDDKSIGIYVRAGKFNSNLTLPLTNDLWVMQFEQKGTGNFSVTNDGTLETIRAIAGIIKVFIDDINPAYITFRGTDKDQEKASQKDRIYDRYLNDFGYYKIDGSTVPPKIQQHRNHIYGKR